MMICCMRGIGGNFDKLFHKGWISLSFYIKDNCNNPPKPHIGF